MNNVRSNGKISSKLLSVFIVSLFLVSTFCVVLIAPTQSEATKNDDFFFSPNDASSSECTDFPENPTLQKDVADFTKDPNKALEVLNASISERKMKCEWDNERQVLSIPFIDFITNCANDADGLGAALILPSGATILLDGPCRISTAKLDTTRFNHTYGLYCEGNLTIDVKRFTIEFALDNFDKTGEPVDTFSAAIYVGGKLTVKGTETGRLATRVSPNTYSPVMGIYANELELLNAELLCRALSGTATGVGEMGDYSTVGIYCPSITVDVMANQEISLLGGLCTCPSNYAVSCGAVTEKMEVRHGTVRAMGGSATENARSYGIQFVGNNQSLSGTGRVCATGGVAQVSSYGIKADALSITDTSVYLSCMYTMKDIATMKAEALTLTNCHLNGMIGYESRVALVNGLEIKQIYGVDSEISVCIQCGSSVIGLLSDILSLTRCTVDVEIKDSLFEKLSPVVGISCDHLASFDYCDVSIKIGDSGTKIDGINVRSNDNLCGLFIRNSKFSVETGKCISTSNANLFCINVHYMEIIESDVSLKAGNSNYSSYGIYMDGGDALIKKSRVVSMGGDLDDGTAANGTWRATCGLYTEYSVSIVDSETVFTGGDVRIPMGKSYGVFLEGKEGYGQEFKITGGKFFANGKTVGLKVDNMDNTTLSCTEKLYGKNKDTGIYEQFDIANIGKYTDVATSNWIEVKETDSSAFAIVVAIVVVFVGLVAVYCHRRD